MVLAEIFGGFWDIIRSPFVDLSALWFVLPLVLLWIILELYFDRHANEDLGWNTALGNSITMFWISIQLMRYLFSDSFKNYSLISLIIVIIVLAYSIFLAYISFTHKLEAKITFHLASPTAVYYWTAITSLWVYGSLSLTMWIFIDVLIFFALLLLFVYLFRNYGPFKRNLNDKKR